MVKIKARFIKEIYYNSDNDYHVQKCVKAHEGGKRKNDKTNV